MEGITSVVAITIICYLVGLVCKSIPNIKNEIIPITVGVAGFILGIVAMYVAPELVPATNVIEAGAIGIVSGLASTGVNQIGKQVGKLSVPTLLPQDEDTMTPVDEELTTSAEFEDNNLGGE